MKFERIARRLYAEPLMIEPGAFVAIDAAFQRRVAGGIFELGDLMPDQDEDDYTVTPDGVAILRIKGAISRDLSKMEKACGGVDLLEVQESLAELAADPNVRAVVLDIDSPGGSVTGVEETAAKVRELRASKPVIAHTGSMAASAAYWIASAASAVYADESASVGSVGVYMAMLDESRAFANEGLAVDVIKSQGSPLKGAGIPGTSLTPEQRTNFQAQVDYLYNRFSGAVKAGRKRVADEALKGSTFYGSEAKRLGLIDSVASLETAIRDAAAMAKIR